MGSKRNRRAQGARPGTPLQDARPPGRRRFLVQSGLLLAGAAAPGFAATQSTGARAITADLMHEHGLILRVLLIYDEFRGRLTAGKRPDPRLLNPIVNLMSTAVHGFHERVEEEVVFERLRSLDAHEELVSRLAGQHSIGRELTAEIARGVDPGGRPLPKGRFAEALADFIALYAPHEAREDTVVFPAFEQQVAVEEMAAMRDRVAEQEQRTLGKDWFPRAVRQVAEVEQALGIHELKVKPPA